MFIMIVLVVKVLMQNLIIVQEIILIAFLFEEVAFYEFLLDLRSRWLVWKFELLLWVVLIFFQVLKTIQCLQDQVKMDINSHLLLSSYLLDKQFFDLKNQNDLLKLLVNQADESKQVDVLVALQSHGSGSEVQVISLKHKSWHYQEQLEDRWLNKP